jgi:hypothetical protein
VGFRRSAHGARSRSLLFDADETEHGFTLRAKPSLPKGSPPPAPPFDAEELLAQSGDALILYEGRDWHAARIARDLLRHRNQQFAITQYPGSSPDDHSAIIISRRNPPTGWQRTLRGYWVREWKGPPQLWVRNSDHVFRDTDPLMTDMLSLLTPQRETPLPYPDANYDLASRFGELPSGEAEASPPNVGFDRLPVHSLNLSGGEVTLEVADAKMTAKAAADRHLRLLKLRVSRSGGGTRGTALEVVLPPGWLVVYARDMTGKWERVEDPVRQYRLSDGRISLICEFPPGDAPVYRTFDLARLPVKSV